MDNLAPHRVAQTINHRPTWSAVNLVERGVRIGQYGALLLLVCGRWCHVRQISYLGKAHAYLGPTVTGAALVRKTISGSKLFRDVARLQLEGDSAYLKRVEEPCNHHFWEDVRQCCLFVQHFASLSTLIYAQGVIRFLTPNSRIANLLESAKTNLLNAGKWCWMCGATADLIRQVKARRDPTAQDEEKKEPFNGPIGAFSEFGFALVEVPIKIVAQSVGDEIALDALDCAAAGFGLFTGGWHFVNH